MRLFWGGPPTPPRTPRPRRHTPRTPPLPASLHERNTAPARQPTAWLASSVKEISPMLAQNGQNTALFGVPGRRIFHGTPPPFTQGRLFFHLNPPYPTGGTKLALLGPISAQAGKNSPSTHHPKISAFSPAGRIFSRSHPESTLAGRVFSRRWVPQTPHSTRQPPRLKQMTPMRVDHCHKMKPPAPLRAPRRTRLKPLTPLLAQNSQIQAIFHPQRCHGFHAPLAEHPQRRRRFHETPNRSAGSQKGAQTLMLAASVTLLVASEQFDSKEMP